MGCWCNVGVSKENLHFDVQGKLAILFLFCFFLSSHFLKQIENMFSDKVSIML